MNIRYITCSDLREDIPHSIAIDLLRMGLNVELGIQAHPSAMSHGMPRNTWLNGLLDISKKLPDPLNIAIHVNYQWCSLMCDGYLPPEIAEWFYIEDPKTKKPLIKRWQLNIGDGTNIFNAHNLSKIIKNHPNREFILPVNNRPAVQTAVQELNDTGAQFSLLYDSSYGVGKSPDTWLPPAYPNHAQGYAGGLGPENITENLEKISAQLPDDYTTWIDAEGKLMIPGTRQFDINRARGYVNGALNWMRNNAKVK